MRPLLRRAGAAGYAAAVPPAAVPWPCRGLVMASALPNVPPQQAEAEARCQPRGGSARLRLVMLRPALRLAMLRPALRLRCCER
jgi:hypothetical protein